MVTTPRDKEASFSFARSCRLANYQKWTVLDTPLGNENFTSVMRFFLRQHSFRSPVPTYPCKEFEAYASFIAVHKHKRFEANSGITFFFFVNTIKKDQTEAPNPYLGALIPVTSPKEKKVLHKCCLGCINIRQVLGPTQRNLDENKRHPVIM